MKKLSFEKIQRGLNEFRQHPRKWMALHGANLAGILWNTGDGVQFLLGAVTLSPRIILSSCINAFASCNSMIFGKRDWGVALASILAIIGTGTFLSPNLISGDPRTCVGYGIFCCAVSFGIFSAYLSKKFPADSPTWLHETLGRPRRMMGVILCISRMPIIFSATAHRQWTIVIPFIIWSLADLSMSLSREEIATQPSGRV